MRSTPCLIVLMTVGVLAGRPCFAQLTSLSRSLADKSIKIDELRRYSAIPKLVPELRMRTERLNALRTLRSTTPQGEAAWIDEAIQKELDRCLELTRDIANDLEKYGLLDEVLANYEALVSPQLRCGLPEHEKRRLLESGFSQEEVNELSLFITHRSDEIVIGIRQKRKTDKRPLADQVEDVRKQSPRGPRLGPALEIVAGGLTIGLDLYAQMALLPTLGSVAAGVGLLGDGLAALGI